MKRFFRSLGIFLALVGVGVASAFIVILLLLRQEEVRVTDLTGQDIVSVIETVRQQGLELKVERQEPNATLPKDTVISQTPTAGTGIKKGRQIRVVVSTGPSEVQAPKLAGEHFRKAEIIIRQAGFVPGAVSRVSSETVERDMVIAQSPPPGTPLEKGGGISILVSSGRQAQMFVMPKLIGKKPESAIRIIDRMGLQHRIIYKSAADKSQAVERLVISQKPQPGYPVTADAGVEMVVSK